MTTEMRQWYTKLMIGIACCLVVLFFAFQAWRSNSGVIHRGGCLSDKEWHYCNKIIAPCIKFSWSQLGWFRDFVCEDNTKQRLQGR